MSKVAYDEWRAQHGKDISGLAGLIREAFERALGSPRFIPGVGFFDPHAGGPGPSSDSSAGDDATILAEAYAILVLRVCQESSLVIPSDSKILPQWLSGPFSAVLRSRDK